MNVTGNIKCELEIEKEITVERIRQESEKAKLEMEGYRLSRLRDGALSGEGQGEQVPRGLYYEAGFSLSRLTKGKSLAFRSYDAGSLFSRLDFHGNLY